MKKRNSIYFACLLVFTMSCKNAETQNFGLGPKEFSAKITSTQNPSILDVRTPGEFAEGHIANAINSDWNGNEFDAQISTLNKSDTIFIYCLGGGRSAEAANHMRKMGFNTIYELNGGMMGWRNDNLPEVNQNANASPGMTTEDFNQLISTDKLVLVDFYAEWCAPCRKMKPFLEEISTELKDKVVLVRIDVDKNKFISKEKNISALPVLQIYKNKTIIWQQQGFVDKNTILKNLN